MRLDAAQLTVLLDFARAEGRPEHVSRVERLPRRRSERLTLLTHLAASVFEGGERLTEATLGERLEPLVMDVALVRRAMIDDGVLDRNSRSQEYWLRDEPAEIAVSD